MTSNDSDTVSAGLRVWKCSTCGARYFPARLICHKCGGGVWTDESIFEGMIEESTRIVSADNSKSRFLATVNAAGLRFIAALATPLPDGARVVLEERNGAPWAVIADSE